MPFQPARWAPGVVQGGGGARWVPGGARGGGGTRWAPGVAWGVGAPAAFRAECRALQAAVPLCPGAVAPKGVSLPTL